MKKSMALMMLFLLLCAMSATAFAATIHYYDAKYNEKTVEVGGGTYTLPQYGDMGLPLPDGKTFYAWRVVGKEAYLKPGTKIDLKENDEKDIYAQFVNANERYYEVKFVSDRYNNHEAVGYLPCLPNELIRIMYPYHYGYGTDAENLKEFLYWRVEGEIDKFDASYPDAPDVGWLFARALADDDVTLNPDDYFYVQSDLTITAIWGDGKNPGSGNPGSGSNTGNPNTGANGDTAVKDLPKTGDESLPMGFLLVLMSASLCGIAVLAKRRIS